jgi:hypothetical protein
VKQNLSDLRTFRNYPFVRSSADRPEKERPEWMSELSAQAAPPLGVASPDLIFSDGTAIDLRPAT